MGTVFAIIVVLFVLLWLTIALRRRAMRTYLLATGVEVAGRAWIPPARGRRTPHMLIRYTDSQGVERTVRKTVVSAGDSELVRKGARVVFHRDRTTRDDYVLVGFGPHPSTWFRVSFTKAGSSD